MARTKGALGKKTLAEQKLIEAGVIERVETPEERADRMIRQHQARAQRPAADIIETTLRYFKILEQQLAIGLSGSGRGIIVTGAAGVGKTFNVERQVMESHKKTGARFLGIKGKVTAAALYAAAFEYSGKGEIIYMDDADEIFYDQSGLNLLKALLDTSAVRTVSWLTARTAEGSEVEGGLPPSFEYNGYMVFLSNENFQARIDEGGKLSPHLSALISRAHFLDLRLHSRREVMAWARHIVKTTGLMRQYGISEAVEEQLMSWIEEHASALRETSIRTAIKITEYYRADPSSWKWTAGAMLLKE